MFILYYPPPAPLYLPPEPSVEQKQTRLLRKDANVFCGAALGFVALSIFAVIILGVLSKIFYGTTALDPRWEMGYYLFATLLLTGPPFLLAAWLMKIPASFCLPLGKPKGKVSIALIFLGLGGCMAGDVLNIILYYLFGMVGMVPKDVDMPMANTWTEKIILLIGVSIFPGIVEELIFRGLILQWLRRYGDGFAILISSLMFSLIHLNIAQIPFALVVGLVLGIIAVKTGSLRLCTIIHMVNNALSLVAMWVADLGPILDLGETKEPLGVFFFPLLLIVLLVCGVGALISLLIRRRGFFKLPPLRSALGPGRCWAAFFTAPCTIIMVIIALISTAASFDYFW